LNGAIMYEQAFFWGYSNVLGIASLIFYFFGVVVGFYTLT